MTNRNNMYVSIKSVLKNYKKCRNKGLMYTCEFWLWEPVRIWVWWMLKKRLLSFLSERKTGRHSLVTVTELASWEKIMSKFKLNLLSGSSFKTEKQETWSGHCTSVGRGVDKENCMKGKWGFATMCILGSLHHQQL